MDVLETIQTLIEPLEHELMLLLQFQQDIQHTINHSLEKQYVIWVLMETSVLQHRRSRSLAEQTFGVIRQSAEGGSAEQLLNPSIQRSQTGDFESGDSSVAGYSGT